MTMLTQKKIMDSKNGLELQDLRNEEIHMVCFKESDFHGIDMRNTNIAHTNFVNSSWEHIYFSNVHVNYIQMGGTVFENVIRPDAERSQLSEEPGTDGWVNIEPVVFKNSDLSTAKFENCNLSNVEITDCNIEGLSINGILLTELLDHYRRKTAVD
ncbi:pentapeptide repeat-containing protein [Cohnella sp. JJ-181]|uniref:pentapeptide repeat-containing protein n=1 Tax=Cohnella rhizoplanae TaxID=2974897 RepID=UPI0022FF766C|nr:pentapeptide repeat-containing protein [Cohnella sp. JJ-181]CAI6087544.1 hypothetical protein COHCIP112018_05580 [Cohnella sp. JJ-181]